jgi:hypothetical protein
MTSANHPGPADFDLSDRLAKRAITATPGRLRHLRSEGQIPGPDVIPGEGWRYSDNAEDYTADLLQLLGVRRDLSLATLALFGRGRVPPGRALKAAYATEFKRWMRDVSSNRTAGPSALDSAEQFVAEHGDTFEHTALGRTMRDRVRRLQREGVLDEEENPSAVVQSALTQSYLIIATGEPSSEQSLEELLNVGGVGAIARDEWQDVGPIGDQVVDDELLNVVRELSVDRVSARVAAASLRDLIQARDAIASLIDVVLTGGAFFRFMTPLPDAFGFGALTQASIDRLGAPHGSDLVVARFAPLFLVLQDVLPTYAEGLYALRRYLPQLKAQLSMADSLPPKLRGPDGMRKLQRLPKDEQRKLIRDWAINNPADAQLAGVDVSLL